jgi:hypothetical protein
MKMGLDNDDKDIKSNLTINKNKEWKCIKCKCINFNEFFRCKNCNYFDYEVYSGIYNKKDKEKKMSGKKDIINPIIMEDNYIDYNEKENYEFKREEKHKFIKCWHCGRENIYYKLKCNYCRFPINDSEEPKVKKTQLTQYDIIHGITFDNKPKIRNVETNYNDIKIKSNSIKEEKKYKNLGVNWTCKFCKKLNKESIKYCKFCFKDRI